MSDGYNALIQSLRSWNQEIVQEKRFQQVQDQQKEERKYRRQANVFSIYEKMALQATSSSELDGYYDRAREFMNDPRTLPEIKQLYNTTYSMQQRMISSYGDRANMYDKKHGPVPTVTAKSDEDPNAFAVQTFNVRKARVDKTNFLTGEKKTLERNFTFQSGNETMKASMGANGQVSVVATKDLEKIREHKMASMEKVKTSLVMNADNDLVQVIERTDPYTNEITTETSVTDVKKSGRATKSPKPPRPHSKKELDFLQSLPNKGKDADGVVNPWYKGMEQIGEEMLKTGKISYHDSLTSSVKTRDITQTDYEKTIKSYLSSLMPGYSFEIKGMNKLGPNNDWTSKIDIFDWKDALKYYKGPNFSILPIAGYWRTLGKDPQGRASGGYYDPARNSVMSKNNEYMGTLEEVQKKFTDAGGSIE